MPTQDAPVHATHEAYYKKDTMNESLIISAQGLSADEALDMFKKIMEMTKECL